MEGQRGQALPFLIDMCLLSSRVATEVYRSGHPGADISATAQHSPPEINAMTKPPSRSRRANQPHAQQRQGQRGLNNGKLNYVLDHGQSLRRTGATFIFLRKRDIPPADRHNDHKAKLAGSVVLLSDDEQLITVYRNPHALRAIKRKPKRRRPAQDDRRFGRA